MSEFNFTTEFTYKENKSNLFISFNRAAFIFFIFLIVTFIFSLKIIYLGIQKKNVQLTQISKSDFRSSILDRDGNILAKSVITTNIGINPKLVINKEKLLINLKLIFPKKNFNKIEKRLEEKKFFYLEKKNITRKL